MPIGFGFGLPQSAPKIVKWLLDQMTNESVDIDGLDDLYDQSGYPPIWDDPGDFTSGGSQGGGGDRGLDMPDTKVILGGGEQGGSPNGGGGVGTVTGGGTNVPTGPGTTPTGPGSTPPINPTNQPPQLPQPNTGNKWLDYILWLLLNGGIGTGANYLFNQLNEILNGSSGDQLRKFLEDAYPDLTQWETIGAGAGAGFAQNQGGRLQRETLGNQLKIAEIEYRKAVDTANINAGPGHRQAGVSEAKLDPEVRKLQADSFYRESEVSLLAANIRSAEAEALMQEARSVLSKELAKTELNAQAAQNIWTSLLNIVDSAVVHGGNAIGTVQQLIRDSGMDRRAEQSLDRLTERIDDLMRWQEVPGALQDVISNPTRR